jgi:hypothetical protein
MISNLRFVHHPEVWRYRAALTRVAAEHSADLNAKEHELRLATLYERLARYAEERFASERASRRLLPAPSKPERRMIAARNDSEAQIPLSLQARFLLGPNQCPSPG